jgi:pyrimidine-nucleoside phosphorylase
MRAVDIIIKKREKQALTEEEIHFFVEGFTRGDIPDYQAAAWAMAVLLNGMTAEETKELALAMAHSGDLLDLTEVVPLAVDKHSTGGVGDKTSLVVGPVAAACGLPVGKMSGRGLGFSGGTLDKLESIPGYRCDLSNEEFLAQLDEIGIVITGQTGDLAPADGKLYALRDVTGTVESIPLIASSIMSKKLAAGAQAIVLDVKVGLGAFMHTQEEAHRLATLMVEIARLADREAVALISDMNQPLGCAVGNALEVKEAVDTLQGKGPQDFHQHCLEVSAQMLLLGKIADTEDQAHNLAAEAIRSGKAWKAFRELIRAQDGDVEHVVHPEKLPRASFTETVPAPRSGYLKQIHAREIGLTALDLGAGREKKGQPIDHAVGVVVHCKVGDHLEKGDDLVTIHANHQEDIEPARQRLLKAHRWSEEAVEPLPPVYDIVR